MKAMPKLQPLPSSRKFIDAWGGYDHNAVISENAFYDMKNMSSDLYPVASVRRARDEHSDDIGGSPTQYATTLHHRDDWPVVCNGRGDVFCGGHVLEGLLDVRFHIEVLCEPLQLVSFDAHKYCMERGITAETNESFIYDEQSGVWEDGGGWYGDMEDLGIVYEGTPHHRDGINVTVLEGSGGDPEQIVSMGAWCIVWPEKVWFNAVNLANGDEMIEGEDYGHLEVHNEVSFADRDTASMRLCDKDGNLYGTWEGENVTGLTVSKTAPEDPEDGDYWLDSSDEAMPLSVYSSAMSMWSPITRKYAKITSTLDLTSGIRVGDHVRINITAPYAANAQREFDKLRDAGYIEVTAVGKEMVGGEENNYIVVRADIAVLWATGIVYGSINIDVPQMNFVVECGNRLWGCYYGEKDGEHINEIYASKLGDFRSWNTFDGISTDSYVASRGADGKYTGAAVLGDNPLFFREKSFEKVFPASNGAHQITTVHYSGIQEGSWQSPVVIDGTLFYKGTDGIYAYTGSVPRLISEPLGGIQYYAAVAAPLSRKYYISMRDSDNRWNLFVFDAERGMWHREDNAHFHSACEYRGRLYYLGDNTVAATVIGGVDVCTNVPWMIESGTIGLTTPDQKRVSRIVLRMSLELGAEARIYVQYEGGKWHEKQKLFGNSLRTQIVPILPIRCDHMKIKMTGIGGMKLFSAAYTVEQGSDMP